MLPRKTLLAALAVAAAFASTGPAASADETAHGYNNGDTGFVNLSVTQPLAATPGRSSTDVLSMVGHCTYNKTVEPFSENVVVQIVGKGAVSSSDPVNNKTLGVAVRCTLKDALTGAVIYDHWDGLPANVGTWVGVYTGLDQRYVICTQVKALLSNGDVTSQTYPCQPPSLLPA